MCSAVCTAAIAASGAGSAATHSASAETPETTASMRPGPAAGSSV